MTDTIGANNQYGWTCPKCGTWIPSGQYHVCQQANWGTYQYTPDYTVMLERIAVALERLANHFDPTLGELFDRMEAESK